MSSTFDPTSDPTRGATWDATTRRGGFSPLGLPDLILWLDPQFNLQITAGTVDSWTDRVGGNVFSNTGGDWPGVEALNGIAIASFSGFGNNTWLEYSGAVFSGPAGTLFMVTNPDFVSGDRAVFTQAKGRSETNHYAGYLNDSNDPRFSVVPGSNFDGNENVLTAAPTLITLTSDGTNNSMWVNTTQQTLSISGDDGLWFGDVEAATISRIGGLAFDGSDVWDFDGGIAEIIGCDSADAGNVQEWRELTWQYLNNKYALGLSI